MLTFGALVAAAVTVFGAGLVVGYWWGSGLDG